MTLRRTPLAAARLVVASEQPTVPHPVSSPTPALFRFTHSLSFRFARVFVTQVFTHPVDIARLAKTGGDVRFAVTQQTVDCASA